MESTVVTNTICVEHNFLYRLRILGKVCLYFGVATTVLYFQIANRPVEADTYYTNDHNDTTHGGVDYKCGCSLPSSLQKTAMDPDVNAGSLNICYDRSKLETVTVLMYSKSAALLEPQLEPEIKELASYNITYSTIEGGYSVKQQAHDLSGYINDWEDDKLPTDLANLYLNGIRPKEIFPTVDYLQSPEFMSFPKSYVRLTFVFRCNDCKKCPLDLVNGLFQKAVNGSNKDKEWANCFYWGWDNHCADLDMNYYQAKCLLYPTEVLPANFAIKRFFEIFMTLPEIYFPGSSLTTLQPSSLYLNISQVKKNTNSTQLGFVEVIQGSALWSSLLTMFPSLGSCADMHEIEVCNGTSVCNVFANADSYDLRCLDMKNTTKCKILMGDPTKDPEYSTFDNAERFSLPNGTIPWSHLECGKSSCEAVPPHSLHWKTSGQMKNDSLNKFLSSTILNEAWAQQSGVCINTYENVLRFPRTNENVLRFPRTNASAEAERNNSNTIFLESKCANPTGSSSYCWLTGNYQNLSDTKAYAWKKLEDKNLFPDPDRLFVCYRLDDQKFGSWFITTVGVLFGWLGTVEVLLRSEVIIISLINRFRARVRARRVARVQRKLTSFYARLQVGNT